MSSSPDLRIDWCSYAASKYAVTQWHYSKRMPKSKIVRLGAWEDGAFIGTVIFGVGSGHATRGDKYGMARRFEVAELCRVALTQHRTPTSRIVSIAVRMLKQQSSNLRLLTSLADPKYGHVGILYQSMGWIYTGRNATHDAILIRGRIVHPRTLYDRYGNNGVGWLRQNIDPQARKINNPPKHHYLLPLDEEARKRILPLAKPYPKRVGSIEDAPTVLVEEGGS